MSERRVVNNFNARRKAVKLKRMMIKRIAIGGIAVAIVVAGINAFKDDSKDNTVSTTIDTSSDVYSFDIVSDEVLDVTLVNDGFDEAKFNEAVKELQDTGFHCSGVDIDDLNVDDVDSYFLMGITSYEGSSTEVIANYNSGNPASDQLAVAMSVASGHDATDIQRGVHDLGKADGSFKPSNLEEKVKDVGAPNITVAYPSSEGIDTNDILEACARVTDYYKQDGCSAHDEMLYRVKPGDSPYSLGNDICLINGIDKTDVLDSNEILLIKPLSGSFSKDADINIEKVNEINHTL